MAYILLTVLTSVFLLILFKLFERYSINSLVAIIVNYFSAGITGILFLNEPYSLSNSIQSNWFCVALPMGLLFIVVFYLIALTAQKINISTASVANKMSVIMPVLYAVIVLNQALNRIKILGILLALSAVFFVSKTKNKIGKKPHTLWYLPIVVFFGSGLIDVLITIVNAYYINNNKIESAFFSISTFFVALFFGSAFLIILIILKKIKLNEVFKVKNLLGGIALGIPNFFSIYFIFKSLESNILNNTQLFPILNVSNVLLSACVGFFMFKEKLSLLNHIGILIAILSIILLSY
ncbi:MAG: EamA family transporter [Bacteroidetes bacterium]|nr:EamA family transporter [Bacteroidota bacterium]